AGRSPPSVCQRGRWPGAGPVTAPPPDHSTADARPCPRPTLGRPVAVRLAPSTRERLHRSENQGGPFRGRVMVKDRIAAHVLTAKIQQLEVRVMTLGAILDRTGYDHKPASDSGIPQPRNAEEAEALFGKGMREMEARNDEAAFRIFDVLSHSQGDAPPHLVAT